MIPSEIRINKKSISTANWGATSIPGHPGWTRAAAEILGVALIIWRKNGEVVKVKAQNTTHNFIPIEVVGADGPKILDPWSGHGWSKPYDHGLQVADHYPPKISERLLKGPKFASHTQATGSANMDFFLPAAAWVDWYGFSPEAFQYFESYWKFCCGRNRGWYNKSLMPAAFTDSPIVRKDLSKPSGFSRHPSSPAWPSFNEGRLNSLRRNFGDAQHSDFLELFHGYRILRDPSYLEEIMLFFFTMARNSWELSPDNANKKWGRNDLVHSPRVFGWDFTNSGLLLQSLSQMSDDSSANPVPFAETAASQILGWAEYTTAVWSKAFPDACFQNPENTLSGVIKEIGEYVASPWQYASTIPHGLFALSRGLASYFGADHKHAERALSLAQKCYEMADFALDFSNENDLVLDEHGKTTIAKFRTTSGHRFPASVPGIGLWPVAAGLQSRKGFQRQLIRDLAIRAIDKYKLNTNNEQAVSLYRPIFDSKFI